MTAQYFTVLTDYGTQAFANAIATNQPIQFSSFAVGDGNGQAVTTTADRTALVKETHRGNVSAVSLDPRNNKQIIIELTIPEDVGGFYIREMGVFDSTNKLVAYANTPESFKPTLESGSGKVQVLRMILKVSNSQAVTLSIDNSVIFVTRQQLNPKKITSQTTNGFDESGHTHEIEKADTTKAGIVQLTDDTGLDSDKLGLSARAGKKLAQLISMVQLALGNYIQNNKKSNSVTSNSTDDVATSSAVKTAYDKAIDANNNANNRVAKAGDTMNGNLVIDSQSNAWSGIALKNKQNKFLVYEVSPDSEPYFGSMIYRDVAGYNINHLRLPKRNGTIALMDDVDTKVSKTGDVINGMLFIDGSQSGGFAHGLAIRNKAGGENTGGFVDFYQTDNVPRASIWFRDAGNNSTQIEFLNTPEGSDWNRDSRQAVFSITSAGGLWSKSYGWLHDYFAKQADINNVWNELNNTYRKNRFRHQYYSNHYNGAEVFDIPMGDNGLMRVISMRVNIDGYAKVNLPEAFNGYCLVQVTDVGGGQKRVGANIQNGNVVEIHNSGESEFNILAIGWYGW